MKWQFIESGSAQASLQMEKEKLFLRDLKKNSPPLLHFYDFQSNSITYGHFCNPENFLNIEFLEKNKIELTKRVTGGGISFHFSDLTFSLFIPAAHPGFSLNTLQNYAVVNQVIKEALSKFLEESCPISLYSKEEQEAPNELSAFCMARPIEYDLINGEGLKIGGGALRLKREGFLYQGSLNLRPKKAFFLDGAIRSFTVLEAMRARSSSLFGNLIDKEIESKKEKLKFFLKEEFLNFF